jgi:thiamine-phosphate pyrophosphorylase
MAQGTPHRRLYLRLPAQLPAGVQSSLAQAIAQVGTHAGCVLLCRETGITDASHLDETWAEQILHLAHARDIAVLVEGDVELARKIGADGVQVAADAALYARARERLGADAIIGVDCGQSRHDAMVLAELGADYVAFAARSHSPQAQEELAELIGWWSEIFVVPCVAFGVESAATATALAALGADFVAPAESFWLAPEPTAGLAEFAAALDQARNAA